MTIGRTKTLGRQGAALALFLLGGAATVGAQSPPAPQADILIKNGHVVKGIGPNVASYVGAGQVRASAMGYENRQPTPTEMDKIKQLIRQGMEEGAFGLSNGMSYVPNMFFNTAQLIDLCKVAGSYGGIFTIHIRNVAPGDPKDKGLKEAIAIAKGAHIPVEIFHLGASAGMDPDDFIRDVQQARADGVDITGNSYPYETGWT